MMEALQMLATYKLHWNQYYELINALLFFMNLKNIWRTSQILASFKLHNEEQSIDQWISTLRE